MLALGLELGFDLVMRRIFLFFSSLFALCSSLSFAVEKPLLHPLFSDHGVLQRGCEVPVWGWAQPGAKLSVRFAKQTKQAVAGADGKWSIRLDSMEASAEGRVLVVEAEGGGQRVEVKDVLVGDVWLCSGQSNMEMGIAGCNEQEEISKANHPNLRLLTLPHVVAYKPQETFSGNWKPCSPESLRGGFSAAAYFFGKKLQAELNIPIGLIHSSWGGTMIEAWMSGESLKPFPQAQAEIKIVEGIANSTAANPLAEIMNAWFLKHDPGTQKGWEKETTDASKWREVSLPNNYAACGIPGYEGVVWIQREFDLPADWVSKPLVFELGTIHDTDTTWLNGKEIGRTDSYEHARRYKVPTGIAKSGKNIITLRITNAGGGGIEVNGPPMTVTPEISDSAVVPLSGKWRMQETAGKGKTGRPLVGNPRVSTVLYNGMIAPLEPCALTGAIWYQGEANAGDAKSYRKLLPAMIADWRKRFQREDMAFHIVSLANYQDAGEQPRDNAWAELREAQAMTAKTFPHCGLAIAIDIGDAKDIHPKNKRDVGHRLALSALAKTYGKSNSYSGPWYREMKVEGDRIRLSFDHADKGLEFNGATDKAFAIAGADGKFIWAKAEIDGASVIVSSPEVPKPVAVRYAWDSNPQAPLYNGAGLPAVPFRTDGK
jgi:sialate O-acetylesterase